MTHEPLGSACLQPHPVSGARVPDACFANTSSFSSGVIDPKSGLSTLEWQACPRKQQLLDTLWGEADISTNRHHWHLLWQSNCSHIEGFSFFSETLMGSLGSTWFLVCSKCYAEIQVVVHLKIHHYYSHRRLLKMPKVQSCKYAFEENRGLKVSCILIQWTATPERKGTSCQHRHKCQGFSKW